ncbi:hypothetical protein [Jannaschia marina]|uniref:hypothetical protein n=1 Tax=Jannaschia marina TaxID=2741674 RepID=UPI0015CAF55C|nr:hypothetical protein [Jannaschia marina]
MTDKTDDTRIDTKRRGFLKGAALAPAAVAATAAGTAAEAETAATGPQKGLADTEHTRAYFASARF